MKRTEPIVMAIIIFLLSLVLPSKKVSTTGALNNLAFNGVQHFSLGNATLTVLDSVLVVSNIGSTGLDGVAMSLGESDVHMAAGELDSLAVGAVIEKEFRGRLNGTDDQVLVRTTLTNVDGNWEMVPDFSFVGSATYELLLIRDGQTVVHMTGLEGTCLTFLESVAFRCCYLHGKPECSYRFGRRIRVLLPNGMETTADMMKARAENPTVQYDFMSTLNIFARDISEFSLHDLWLMEYGLPHHARAASLFDTSNGKLTMKNIGSTGDDGVRVDFLDFLFEFAPVTSFSASLVPLYLDTNGAQLNLGATGTYDSIPGATFGDVSLTSTGTNLLVLADYTSVMDDSVRIDAYSAGVPVGTTTVPAGAVGMVQSVATPVTEFSALAILPLVSVGFQSSVSLLTSNSVLLVGDEFRFVAAHSGAVANLTKLDIGVALVDSITILDESINDAVGSVNGPSRTPKGISLFQNVPNPFTSTTMIAYELERPGSVMLSVYDVLGRRVRLLVDETLNAGHQTALWDGRDDNGSEVSSGFYFYRLQAYDRYATRRMLLLR